MTGAGFPHSGTSGLTPASGYPELIAANHALHRPLAPRHPPYALSSLTPLPLANLIFLSDVVSLPDCQRTAVLPTERKHRYRCLFPDGKTDMVENTGIEPVTSWLQTRRSPS